MSVLPTCMFVYHICAWCPQKPEKDVISSVCSETSIINHNKTRAINGYGPPFVCCKSMVLCKSIKFS